MTITIYGTTYTTSTWRVLTTLAEKGVEDYRLEVVDVINGQQKNPEFMKLQPFGQIPVLQDGDFIVYESRAMARYVSEKYESQGTPLFGKNLKERALVNQWLEVESQNYQGPISDIVTQIYIGPMYAMPVNEKVVTDSLAKLEKVLDVYEAHLARNKYLAGDYFSMADLSHLPFMYILINGAKKGDCITSRKHVSAWWTDISSRASFQKVLALQKH